MVRLCGQLVSNMRNFRCRFADICIDFSISVYSYSFRFFGSSFQLQFSSSCFSFICSFLCLCGCLNFPFPSGFMEFCLFFSFFLCLLFSLLSQSGLFLSLCYFLFSFFTGNLLGLFGLSSCSGFGLKPTLVFFILFYLRLEAFLLAALFFQLGFQVLHFRVNCLIVCLSSFQTFLNNWFGSNRLLDWTRLRISVILFSNSVFFLFFQDLVSAWSEGNAWFVLWCSFSRFSFCELSV
jgi:hypothetical protein